MALKKKYQTIEELLVYPSLEPTIEVIPDDGAHRYRAQMCAGFPIPEGMTYENEPIKFEIEI